MMTDLLTFLKNHHISYEWGAANPVPAAITFTCFCLDGRSTQYKGIFLATTKNYHYITQSIDNGCIAVIADKKCTLPLLDSSIAILLIDDFENKIIDLLKAFFQLRPFYPKIIGITGTNGKTSTAHFIAQLLNQMGSKVGVLGTLGNGVFQHNQHENSLTASHLTTLDTINLYQHLSNFNEQRVDFIVMEVSSHGIHQNRIKGLVFDVVCFTNLSPEHLDYHHSMEQYFACKARLFSDYVSYTTRHVINLSDNWGKQLHTILQQNKNIEQKNIFTYCYPFDPLDLLENANKHADNNKENNLLLSRDEEGSYSLCYQQKLYPSFTSPTLTTDIEYKNLLCASTTLLALGKPLNDILKHSQDLNSITGRIQKVSSAQHDITVIVDYAHTADALSNVLRNLSRIKEDNAHLICVFGCGGNRDQHKRSQMGIVASKYCTKVYITDDNPRDENPETIRQQIVSGIEHKHTNCIEIANRSLAIEQAIIEADSGNTILIAGKGHEKYQLRMGIKTPFDDCAEAQKALEKRMHAQ